MKWSVFSLYILSLFGLSLGQSCMKSSFTGIQTAPRAILAQIEITSVGGQFVYQALPASVTIERNHGYIVSVNTAVKGIPVNSASPANQVFIVNGVYENSSQGFQLVPFFPYRDGSITIEGPCLLDYGTMRVSPLPFPGNSLTGDNANEFIGFADIGFL
jgi:hypothetical protein